MISLSSENKSDLQRFHIGGKAGNLYRLQELGLNVPRFIVIPQEVLHDYVPESIRNSDPEIIRKFIRDIHISQEEIEELLKGFPSKGYYAVRSSAIDEDGAAFSFAGQFESHLYVTRADLAEKIKSVWCSAFSERVLLYRKTNHLDNNFGLAVIVQEMIDSEVAGVAFGMNPVNGNKDEKVISAVYGLGEGLVSGLLDSDNYILKNGEVIAQLAEKKQQVLFNQHSGNGTLLKDVEKELQLKPTLSDQQVVEIGKLLDLLNTALQHPQDIEFAYKNNTLYLLQTRPVTTTTIRNTPDGEYILWDNSNIVESYPGVTTPLTFSFISSSYEEAYKIFCSYMGVSPSIIKSNERVFANTLGLIKGRVYYNLRTWYHMLAMLPGYSINARFMESMMGVKERFDIPESLRLSKAKAWWSIIKMVVLMYIRLITLPSKRKAFMQLVENTISTYKEINFEEKDAQELMHLYLRFESTLLKEWKAPLINDFFAMIWFGLLQKRCKKYAFSKNPNIHNDLLCGSSDIISTQPIHRSMAIATTIAANNDLKNIFTGHSATEIWKIISSGKEFTLQTLKKEIDGYISDFGERCIGELKLETVSYTQDPVKFIQILKSYVESGTTSEMLSGKTEALLRQTAEQEMKAGLKYQPFRLWMLKKTLRRTRTMVSARENLRYERTRAFGIVRNIFSAMGHALQSRNVLEHPRDIFYLTKEEIFSYIEGTSATTNLKELINLRKNEFQGYQKEEAPAERFATYGIVYNGNDFYSTDKVEKHTGDLKGIGCSPGKVRGKVRIITDPGETSSLNGDILVTTSTDPGWVTLFPSASGIIVERGSLLSHSAIVSREMGIPCIVSVTGLLKTLKSGDLIEMDGSTGLINIITA
ncbi:MAG: phosphoenolpyruvate synthase [Bacteroidetes bacterium]|nr:phosphoenolpyruvate synthase [Bacteroidota bacterium]